jgi:hypothetical protein
MEKKNFTVARIVTHTRSGIGKCERHNERKNESYGNMNADLIRTPMNIHFRNCGGTTYNETLDKLVADGTVSLRGLKEDAKVYDEMILDVNSDYFEQHGGYEFARRFYEEAYRFAAKVYGEAHILSAVMHADEINLALTEKYGHPVYHYHLHIVALPVVEKQVLWSKRCKDPALVGTVKETIQQVSHSKKWKSQRVTDEDGKTSLLPSYRILQDEFFHHMQESGFTDFVRGERGSDAQHLSSLEYQIKQDAERLKEIQRSIEGKAVREKAASEIHKTYLEIDHMGKKGITGKVTITKEDFELLTELAKEGISGRGEIQRLKSDCSRLSMQNFDLQSDLKCREKQLDALITRCRPYWQAAKIEPERVKAFLDSILEPLRREEKQVETILYRKEKVRTQEEKEQ